MGTDASLQVEIIWFDENLLEVRLSASNGLFAGRADCYVARDGLAAWRDELRGFPRAPTDSRVLEIGAFGRDAAGGGARIGLRCVDAAGHAEAEVTLESDEQRRGIRAQTVSLRFEIEAAAVDRFARELARLGAELTGVARLEGVRGRSTSV